MNPVEAVRPDGQHEQSVLEDSSAPESQVRPTLPGARVDAIFFTIGAIGTGYLAWLLAMATWRHFPVNIIAIVLIWAVTAYLTLPRLHRMLTSIYLPSYFLGRARTSDGLLGDPVNLAMNGTARQIHTAMTAAGWVLADDMAPKSALKTIVSAVARRSYPKAPVSRLFLFGRVHDLAYQQEVDGNANQRHHLRLWRCPDGWPLPGGGRRVAWLGAGTYDTAVGFSFFTLQITHRIAAEIDHERDYIVDTLHKSTRKWMSR